MVSFWVSCFSMAVLAALSATMSSSHDLYLTVVPGCWLFAVLDLLVISRIAPSRSAAVAFFQGLLQGLVAFTLLWLDATGPAALITIAITMEGCLTFAVIRQRRGYSGLWGRGLR